MPKGYNLSQGLETSMKDKSVGEKGNFKQHQTVDSYNTVGVAEFIRRKIEVVIVMITRVTTGYMKKRERIFLWLCSGQFDTKTHDIKLIMCVIFNLKKTQSARYEVLDWISIFTGFSECDVM